MISTIEITPDPHEIGTTEHDPGIEPSIYRSNIPHIDIINTERERTDQTVDAVQNVQQGQRPKIV